MKRESRGCASLEHVPSCSTWPPPWLDSPAAAQVETPATSRDDSRDVTPPPPTPTPGLDPAAAGILENLRRRVDALASDPGWRDTWNRRHGSDDGWRSPVRVATNTLDDFSASGPRALADVQSLDRFLRRLLDGEFFSAAEPVNAAASEVGGR